VRLRTVAFARIARRRARDIARARAPRRPLRRPPVRRAHVGAFANARVSAARFEARTGCRRALWPQFVVRLAIATTGIPLDA